MNRLQYSFASYILNVFVSVGMSKKCAILFKTLNTAQNGRLSRDEFIKAFRNKNYQVRSHLRDMTRQEITASSLFRRIKSLKSATPTDNQSTEDDYLVYSEFLTIALNQTNQVNETILEMMYLTIVTADSNSSNSTITLERIKDFFQWPTASEDTES